MPPIEAWKNTIKAAVDVPHANHASGYIPLLKTLGTGVLTGIK
jgi:hypothetical protein